MYNRATTTAQVAADLRDVAGRLEAMGLTAIAETHVGLSFQVLSHKGAAPEADRIAAVGALAKGILDVEAEGRSDTFGLKIGGVNLNHINVNIFTGIESQRERELREENDKLRAQVEKLLAP